MIQNIFFYLVVSITLFNGPAFSQSNSNGEQFVEPALFESLESIDMSHPSAFYTLCGSYLEQKKLKEASVVYLIAKNRFQLYNKTNPNYEESGDGALNASFSMIYGLELKEFLANDLSIYGQVLQSSGTWYKENKHFYFDNEENEALYDAQVKGMLELAEKINTDPEGYKKELERQRKEQEAEFQKEMERIEKELDEMTKQAEDDDSKKGSKKKAKK